MSYYFNKTVDMTFDEAISKVTEELKKEGFGVLTEIDVTAALSLPILEIFSIFLRLASSVRLFIPLAFSGGP
jgi:hypothetical protein